MKKLIAVFVILGVVLGGVNWHRGPTAQNSHKLEWSKQAMAQDISTDAAKNKKKKGPGTGGNGRGATNCTAVTCSSGQTPVDCMCQDGHVFTCRCSGGSTGPSTPSTPSTPH